MAAKLCRFCKFVFKNWLEYNLKVVIQKTKFLKTKNK
jgi:hypothetical protein